MGLSSSVWDRSRVRGSKNYEMSVGAYMFAVCGFTIFGLLVSSMMAVLTMDWQPNIFLLLLVGLAVPITGIIISMKSDNWAISFVGYLLVVLGLGSIIGPTMAMYKTSVVIVALVATLGVTVVTSLIGIIHPKSLESWGIYLFAALVALILVRIGQVILLSMGVRELWYIAIIEYAGAVLFSLYIIYDWNRAIRLPHNLDNAVDSAVAIYLYIANLFLHLLRIIGASSSSSND